MNSLISMILVLSSQNDYRSRRVTEICKGRVFCSDRTVFTNLHAHKGEFQILRITFKAFLTFPSLVTLPLSLTTHSSPESLSSVCVSSPTHTSDSLALLRILCAWTSRSPELL